ncbi:MAG TPA: hypothetical protein VEA59_04565 [Patescibacteria group bacterium]|nr:hypothetical protein [Patescibacteria group bacterium]
MKITGVLAFLFLIATTVTTLLLPYAGPPASTPNHVLAYIITILLALLLALRTRIKSTQFTNEGDALGNYLIAWRVYVAILLHMVVIVVAHTFLYTTGEPKKMYPNWAIILTVISCGTHYLLVWFTYDGSAKVVGTLKQLGSVVGKPITVTLLTHNGHPFAELERNGRKIVLGIDGYSPHEVQSHTFAYGLDYIKFFRPGVAPENRWVRYKVVRLWT